MWACIDKISAVSKTRTIECIISASGCLIIISVFERRNLYHPVCKLGAAHKTEHCNLMSEHFLSTSNPLPKYVGYLFKKKAIYRSQNNVEPVSSSATPELVLVENTRKLTKWMQEADLANLCACARRHPVT